MTSISGANLTPVSGKLSDLRHAKVPDGFLNLRPRPTMKELTGPADNAPENIYATIVKDGRTIATFDKKGGIMTPNDVAIPQNLAMAGGPDPRIAQMLKLHGGTVEYVSDTRIKSESINAQTLFVTQQLGS